ncbi:ABC transporter substrate-binding protein [Anatilimnocola floriformis]|uniref:ABC transporter substrate-binding protein n=1 Tax=Anatilimnocola floriformis TaxID=2948575 RepID=UPI0020C1F06C|nr:ABC transporter substrate-binding protein [Anatilimnocola floriformis]
MKFIPTLLLLIAPLTAFAAEPLHRQAPFDEIKLDENNNSVLLKVKPLDLIERKVPPPANRRGDLEVELLDRPGEKFAIAWSSIVDVRLFEDRVLAEAEKLAGDGKYDDAQGSFRYLEQKHPQLPGLKPAIENFLWSQIGGSFRAGKHDETLALLVELHRRNPQRQGLSTAYERTTIELVKQRLATKNYRGARGLLASYVKRFPEAGPAVVAPYHTQLQEQATALVTQAQAAAAAEKWSEANTICQQALDVWPAVAGGSALSQQIHTKFPAVTVGVIGSPVLPTPNSSALTDWHVRRLNHLLATPIVELVDSEKGPVYRSHYGRVNLQADAKQFLLKLENNKESAPDLARRIKPAGVTATAITGVRARGLSELVFEFQNPQLRPAAWLQFGLLDSNGNATVGNYTAEPAIHERTTLRRRASVTAPTAAPQLIHERKFPEATPALLALRRGQINVLDRVPPWELARLRNNNEIKLLPYAIPTVHLLIPNSAKPFTANRHVRRALLYALDRESILKQGLLGDESLPGCEVISGPFPKGPDRLPWTYACDPEIRPRGYDPSLASVLLEIGRAEAGLNQPTPQALVLAHDDQPTTKIACQSIARQLARIGQPITLQQTTGGTLNANADLQYVEVAITEPLVDVWSLLGPAGIAAPCSPLMQEHFRGLETAADLAVATSRLQAMHRLVAAELPVIPLWQTTNYLAVHTSLQGLAERPVSLYEDVLNWQVAWRPPQE